MVILVRNNSNLFIAPYKVFKDDPIFKLLKGNIFRDINNEEAQDIQNKKQKSSKENSQNDALISEILTYEHLDFTLRYLNSTLNDNLRNITEESIIKCPFNTTQSNLSAKRNKWIDRKLFENKEGMISFEPRVRQIDIQYELDNNQKFDDGVFVVTQKSRMSKSKSGLFSQKSRTRTFTSKKDSSKTNLQKSNSFYKEENKEEQGKYFNQFGEKGIHEIKLDDQSKIKLDYNLVYA